MGESRVTVLADGRDLGWLELGEPEGPPVFAFHGTPGSRLQLTLDETPIRDASVRLVCPDRARGHTWVGAARIQRRGAPDGHRPHRGHPQDTEGVPDLPRSVCRSVSCR
jgi:hypothetical protein